MTSLESSTKKRSFAPIDTMFTVGSKPGMPDESGSGPDEQAKPPASANAAINNESLRRGFSARCDAVRVVGPFIELEVIRFE